MKMLTVCSPKASSTWAIQQWSRNSSPSWCAAVASTMREEGGSLTAVRLRLHRCVKGQPWLEPPLRGRAGLLRVFESLCWSSDPSPRPPVVLSPWSPMDDEWLERLTDERPGFSFLTEYCRSLRLLSGRPAGNVWNVSTKIVQNEEIPIVPAVPEVESDRESSDSTLPSSLYHGFNMS